MKRGRKVHALSPLSDKINGYWKSVASCSSQAISGGHKSFSQEPSFSGAIFLSKAGWAEKSQPRTKLLFCRRMLYRQGGAILLSKAGRTEKLQPVRFHLDHLLLLCPVKLINLCSPIVNGAQTGRCQNVAAKKLQ